MNEMKVYSMNEMKVYSKKQQTNYLTCTSCITLVSIYYSWKYHYYVSCFITFCVFCTSVNYWRYPIYGLRRNIDRITVAVSLTTQTIHMRNQPQFNLYCIVLGTAITFYPLSKILHKMNYIWLSVISHSMLHLLANISNLILYNVF
jgi:hypothetical protein